MDKQSETKAEAYDRLVVECAILEAEIARLHKCTGRGDHGPMGNLRCVLDAVITMRESYDTSERERKDVEQERDELRRKLGVACDRLSQLGVDLADIITEASTIEPAT